MKLQPNPTDEIQAEIDKVRQSCRPLKMQYAELEKIVGPSIFSAIETFFAVSEDRLKSRDSSLYVNRARLACYWLMVYAGIGQMETAAILGRRSQATVSRGLERVEVLLETDPSFVAALDRAKEMLCED
jgi:chromosomal replication initiation ATPase DnaA